MDTSPITPRKGASHHPLMLLAALAVLLFCLVGTAAIMGWLPSSIGGNTANRPLSDADRAALASTLPPAAAPAPLAAGGTQPYPAQAYAPAPAAAYAPAPAPAYAPAPAPARAYPAQPQLALADAAPRHAARSHQLAVRDEPVREHFCSTCGNIESIHSYQTRARGSGVGAGLGAVVGGLLGNQVGSGNGRTLATAAGAVGGAVMGNQVEGNMKASTTWEIRVRLDNGTLRTFHQHSAPQWRTGERVRIVKGSLRHA